MRDSSSGVVGTRLSVQLVQLGEQVELSPLLVARPTKPLRMFSISCSISVCLVSMYVP